MQNIYNVGDIWMWTKNSAEHPNDPDYNYFMITDNEFGYRVVYIKDGACKWYTKSSLEANEKNLVFIA